MIAALVITTMILGGIGPLLAVYLGGQTFPRPKSKPRHRRPE